MNDTIYTTKTVGGSANDNIPNARFTTSELADWLNQDRLNAVSFAIQRNPTTVYKFIRQNYGDAYPNLKQGAEATSGQMENMQTFIERQYNNMPEEKRTHFISTLLHSLPSVAELENWTTPTDNNNQ